MIDNKTYNYKDKYQISYLRNNTYMLFGHTKIVLSQRTVIQQKGIMSITLCLDNYLELLNHMIGIINLERVQSQYQ